MEVTASEAGPAFRNNIILEGVPPLSLPFLGETGGGFHPEVEQDYFKAFAVSLVL